MLRIADPYIAWGYPSMKTIRDLVYKRGYGKVDGNRIPITTNTIIEEKLGEYSFYVSWSSDEKYSHRRVELYNG